MSTVIFALCVTVAFAVGRLLGSRKKYDGAVVINTDDPEKDYFLMEFNGPLVTMIDKPYICLKVKKQR